MTMHAKGSIHSSRKLLTGATTVAASSVDTPSSKARTYGTYLRLPLAPTRKAGRPLKQTAITSSPWTAFNCTAQDSLFDEQKSWEGGGSFFYRDFMAVSLL